MGVKAPLMADRTAPLALAMSSITKTFGGFPALRNASLEVAKGEIHGLLGQNGSGKSTLIKILSGFHAPDPGGRLAIDGRDVAMPLAPGAFHEHRISFVHHQLGLIPALTVLENMLIGKLAHRGSLAINWKDERLSALGASKPAACHSIRRPRCQSFLPSDEHCWLSCAPPLR
jgi:ribose transport system ATP-binding protein